MNKFIFFLTFSFLIGNISLNAEGSRLEFNYLKLLNEQGVTVKEVKPKDQLTVELQYTCRGFSKESVVKIKVELFDADGNIKLEDKLTRDIIEGTRIDRYNLVVPQNISGQYLVVLTLQVLQEDQVLSEVVKTAPFELLVP